MTPPYFKKLVINMCAFFKSFFSFPSPFPSPFPLFSSFFFFPRLPSLSFFASLFVVRLGNIYRAMGDLSCIDFSRDGREMTRSSYPR